MVEKRIVRILLYIYIYIFKFGIKKNVFWNVFRNLCEHSCNIWSTTIVFSFTFRENCTFFPLKKKKNNSLQLSPLFCPSFSHFNDYELITNPHSRYIRFWLAFDRFRLSHRHFSLWWWWFDRFCHFFPRKTADKETNLNTRRFIYFRAGRN